MQQPLEGQLHQPQTGLNAEFRLALHASQIVLDLKYDPLEIDIFSLRNVAADIARSIADHVGYANALYFNVEISSAVCQETNSWTVFGIDILVLAARRIDSDRQIYTDLLIAAAGKPDWDMVMADFRRAMRDPIGTGFYCFRCIETMMQAMKATDTQKDRTGWEALRINLRVDRSAIDWIKSPADLPRHGRPSGISDADRAKVFELTDELIKRYQAFLLSGRNAISEADYPIFAIHNPQSGDDSDNRD